MTGPPESAVLRAEQAAPFIAACCRLPFRTVVDLGCGWGLHTAQFAAAGRDAVGIDRTLPPGAASGGVTLRQADWLSLPGEYDAGYSWHCLEHTADPLAALAAWRRFVRRWLFVGVPRYSRRLTCSHLYNGWNIGQLAYLLALSGWDCREGRFLRLGETVCGIVERAPDVPTPQAEGWGPVADRMPAIFRLGPGVNHVPADFDRLNWYA